MMLWFTILTAIANLSLGLIVYKKNKTSVTHQLFAILTLVFAWWGIANYLSLYSLTPEERLFWTQAVMFFTTPLWPVLFLFVYAFPKEEVKINKFFFTLIVFFTLAAAAFSWTHYSFSKEMLIKGFYPTRGSAILLYGFLVLGSVLLSILTLTRKYYKSRGLEKTQLRYLLLGISTTFSLLTITNFLLVIFFGVTKFVFLGPLFSLILISFVAYSIVKHRLMDVRLAMVKTIAFFLLIGAFAILYFYNLFLWVVRLATFADPRQEVLFSTVLALLMALSFQPLRQFFEKITDRIFYKDRYDPNSLLTKLSKIMTTTIELTDLAKMVLKEIAKQMRISKGTILLIKGQKIQSVKTSDHSIALFLDKADIHILIREVDKLKTEILVFEELKEGEMKQVLRKMETSVVVPLKAKKAIIGLMLLGEKSSGDIYSGEDVKILEIIASEMAIALENAFAYEKIKRFNITLKEEIDKATKDLKEANKKLKELDKLKDEFVSVASHELRTPMTAIKSYLWLALYQQKPLIKGKLKRNITRAYQSTERLIKLVHELLTVSRIEGKRLILELEKFDLYKLAKEVYEDLKVKAKEKKIKFNLQQAESSLIVAADKEKIREVFQNTVGNALKFTPENGRVIVSLQKKNKIIETSIADTGPGIPKKDLPKLFQKFARVAYSYTKTTEYTGTGLGLYIAKQIITLHHGKIWVSSKVGEGSIFTFSLPAKK